MCHALNLLQTQRNLFISLLEGKYIDTYIFKASGPEDFSYI